MRLCLKESEDEIIMKEYKVVYKNGTFEIEVGQNGWIPSKEIAEKILNASQKKTFYRDKKLYLSEREAAIDNNTRAACQVYNGKTVYNRDWLYLDALVPGDLVEENVIDDFLNMLPPACMRSNCFQMGEPHSIRVDENGEERTTFATFKKIAEDIWEFCGDCFRGENQERGTIPAYL